MIFVAKKEITKVLIWMIDNQNLVVRARLHQASQSTLRQLWDDASNPVLIENNRGFHKLDEIGTKANIGIRGFTM